MNNNISSEIEELLEKYSYEELRDELSKHSLEARGHNTTLTIIANTGIHKFSEKYLRGEIYAASHGNFEILTSESITREIKLILKNLYDKLNQKVWEKIYLIPTGHPVISAHIKSFVYRVRRINTIDILYINGKYFEIDIDHRSYALEEK